VAEVIVEAAASAASGSVPYAWFLYLIYALMGVGALFILVVALLLSGLGPVGRRFLFNRGDLVIALFEDGTYDVYKAQRGAFWLWLKSRRVNGAVWLKKGTGFTRSKAPTIYVSAIKSGVTASPHATLYVEKQQHGAGGAADGKTPRGTRERWLNIQSFLREYARGRLLEYRGRLQGVREADADPVEVEIWHRVYEPMLRKIESGGDLNADELQFWAEELQSEPGEKWPRDVLGETWDARKLMGWSVSEPTPGSMEQFEANILAKYRREQAKENTKLGLIIIAIIALVIIGGVLLRGH